MVDKNDSDVQSENAAEQATPEKSYLLKKAEKEITLSDGRKCVVVRAKGKHSMKAAEMAMGMYGKNPSAMQIMNCIMSLVTKVDGEGILPEELEELWAEDYSAIQEAYMDLSGGF